MSPLTKLFVVLQVVLSLLLTAGLVVFVNRTDDFRTAMASKQTELGIAQSRVSVAEADASSARSSAEAAVTAANMQIKDIQGAAGHRSAGHRRPRRPPR